MSYLYQDSKRCYLIDHHSPDPPAVTLDHLDPDEYEHFFDTAQIDSLMVYCKDHWGVTYFDSQVPGSRKHPGVKGDWIRTVRDLTAKKGIEFIAYYCIEYDEGAARAFPEWRVRKADGTPLIRDDLYAKWSLCCYQTGYREYSLSHLEEIVREYHPDALFLDIFGASLCYCDHCRANFQQKYGYPIPETEEELSLHRHDIVDFLDTNAKEYMVELKTRVKAIDPTLGITINFSCHYPKDIRDLLDYQFSEPLLKDNWFSSAYARDTAKGQYPILAPGEASQVYNYDSKAQYICDLSSIAAQGCRVGMYSGSQHPDGTLDHPEAECLGSVYQELKKLEPYFKNRKPVSHAAILQSDASKAVNAFPFQADAILRMKKHNPHTFAILGAMELCEHEKIPYSILPEGEMTAQTLQQYDLVILPEVYIVPDEMVSLLTNYVQKGGRLLISGKTGLWNPDFTTRDEFALSELMGISFQKLHTEYAQNDWSAYLRKCKDTDYHGILSQTTPPVSEFFLEVLPRDAHPEFNFVLPCTACTETDWVNWWSPPPGKDTDFPALLSRSFGEGMIIYAAFDFFTMAARETYRLVPELFHQLYQNMELSPVIQNETDIPNILRTAYFETDTCYYVHQISTLAHTYKGETPPVSGGKLRLQKPVKSARLVYPTEQELPVKSEGDHWEILLPQLEIQQFIVIEKN